MGSILWVCLLMGSGADGRAECGYDHHAGLANPIDRPIGARRMVDIGWTAGIDESQLFGSPVPDHIVATENTGGKPAATARGTASVLSGLWSSMFRSSAGENPGILGYIPAVSQVGSGGSDTIHLTRNHEFLMGRVDGSLRVETQMGNEADGTSGEIVRVATMSITEII